MIYSYVGQFPFYSAWFQRISEVQSRTKPIEFLRINLDMREE
jgi:hypothetical protein